MPVLCFLDTETTSLRWDRQVWEVGLIRREPGKADVEYSWFVNLDDLDLGNADLFSLRIGHFYERHPQVITVTDGRLPLWNIDEVLTQVEELTRGAYLVGAVPGFDAEVLGRQMRECRPSLCPSWHYHLQDVENLALGWLRGRGIVIAEDYDSQWLSEQLGEQPPAEDERHTDLGDARWVREMYDAMSGTGEHR